MINGIINVYKEAGFTSHDVVAKLRGILRQKKIGHTGTLDPEATGVLPVCLGNGTKLCDMFTDKSKEYVAKLRLGVITDTQDMTGRVIEEREICCQEEAVIEAAQSFLGEYMQIPPMYSALKVNGKKLYELAREGKEIERKPRAVFIDEIEILSIELPFVEIRVSCSKGTYIRTLAHDIGEKLGCGAAMESLVRTRVGSFLLKEAVTLVQLEELAQNGSLSSILVPVDRVFEKLTGAVVKPEFRKRIDNGNFLLPEQITVQKNCFIKKHGMQYRIYNDENIFCGIYEYQEKEQQLKPVKMFPVNE